MSTHAGRMFAGLRGKLKGDTTSSNSHQTPSKSDFAPLAGPPPGRISQYPQQPHPTWNPPPYHDWTVIPDTAMLPPPPSVGYEMSPTANATAEEADRALAWTNAHHLWPPQHITPAAYDAIQHGRLALLKAPTYVGDLLPQREAGHWRCRTHRSCKDSSILTNLPMYCASVDSPLYTGRPRTVYFELKVLSISNSLFSFKEADSGIAIGFVAPPYPTFRLPGWERGSLAVHGDDGRRYVNDPCGGIDFTHPFERGETIGMGITISIPNNPPSYGASHSEPKLDIEVFFTRNGNFLGTWNGNEELDAQKSVGGNAGMRGECDIFPAVGVFGGVEIDVFFNWNQWLYKPR